MKRFFTVGHALVRVVARVDALDHHGSCARPASASSSRSRLVPLRASRISLADREDPARAAPRARPARAARCSQLVGDLLVDCASDGACVARRFTTASRARRASARSFFTARSTRAAISPVSSSPIDSESFAPVCESARSASQRSTTWRDGAGNPVERAAQRGGRGLELLGEKDLFLAACSVRVPPISWK